MTYSRRILPSVLAVFGLGACHGGQNAASHCDSVGSCSTCGALSGALVGARYEISKSRFAFGSTPSKEDVGWGTRWVGTHGALAIASCGQEQGEVNAGAPETLLPDWGSAEQDRATHVEAYFTAMGLDSCQVGSAAQFTGSGGFTVHLNRVAENIPVQGSIAYAHFDADNQTTEESLYWPEIPSETIVAAIGLRSILANSTSLAEYKALLPTTAQGDGHVVIHHSSCLFDTSPLPFTSEATYDVQEDSQLGMGETLSFDVSGNQVTPPN